MLVPDTSSYVADPTYIKMKTFVLISLFFSTASVKSAAVSWSKMAATWEAPATSDKESLGAVKNQNLMGLYSKVLAAGESQHHNDDRRDVFETSIGIASDGEDEISEKHKNIDVSHIIETLKSYYRAKENSALNDLGLQTNAIFAKGNKEAIFNLVESASYIYGFESGLKNINVDHVQIDYSGDDDDTFDDQEKHPQDGDDENYDEGSGDGYEKVNKNTIDSLSSISNSGNSVGRVVAETANRNEAEESNDDDNYDKYRN